MKAVSNVQIKINVETAAATVNRHSRDDQQYFQVQTESLRKCSNKELSKINQTQHGDIRPINRVVAKKS